LPIARIEDKTLKQNRQLARVVADFLEAAAQEMPPDQAGLLRRSAQLLLEQHDPPPAIAAKRELPPQKPEAPVESEAPVEPKAPVKPESTAVQEKGVTVLDGSLGLMLTEPNAVEKIIRAVTVRQRQMRERGLSAGEVDVQLKFSRPAGAKVGITMCEYFDVEELKKDLSAVHRLGFNCVAGYAC
jgi:hypothetical protein